MSFSLAVACALAIAKSASAESVDVAFPESARVLRGHDVKTVLMVPIAAGEALSTEPELVLNWVSSELVTLDASTLTVEVDAQPVRSVRLAQLSASSQGTLRAKLGKLGPGFHQLQIAAHLEVPGDRCQDLHAQETWLRILSSSVVHYERAVLKEEPATLANIATRWTVAATGEQPKVLLMAAGSRAKPALLAFIEADHWLRSLGVSPVSEDGADNSLSLAVQGEAGTEREPWLSLAQALDKSLAPTASVSLVGKRVYVLARNAEALHDAVLSLSTASVRELCAPNACLFGARAPSHAITAANPAPDTSTALTVFTLADAGYLKGWVARGIGDHSLHFQWLRPSDYDVHGWPTLHVTLSGAQDQSAAHSQSRMSVELNDTPIAEYALDRVDSNLTQLEVRIPREHWQDEVWAFTLHVVLAPGTDTPCAHVDSDRFWTVVSASSSLTVPRTQNARAGLAALFEQSRSSLPPILYTGNLDDGGLRALAAASYPFRALHPGEALRFVDDEAACTNVCIRANQAHGDSSSDVDLPIGPDALWADPTGNMPLLPASGTVQLSRAECRKNRCVLLQISMASPLLLDAAIQAPELATYSSARALYIHDQWKLASSHSDSSLRLSIGPAPLVSGSDLPLRTSLEETRLRSINIGWVLLAVACLALLSWLLRRARKLAALSEQR